MSGYHRINSNTGKIGSQIYQNNTDNFTEIGASLQPVWGSSVAWGDYDNDGDLDILITGNYRDGDRVSKIYRNNGNDNFTDISVSLIGVDIGSVAWGDYDNDRDLDILLTGWNGSSSVAKIYRNDGSAGNSSWNFTDIGVSLSGAHYSSVAWGDYDNDGNLDIILTGLNASSSKVYRNEGNGIFTNTVSFPGIFHGSVAWGDYDTAVSDVMRYTQKLPNLFLPVATTIFGVPHYCGNRCNDGDLDILFTGWTPDSLAIRLSKIYQNNGDGSFTDLNAALTGVSHSSVAWGDYDKDSDLDILLTGNLGGGLVDTAKIYQNNTNVTNTAPIVPTVINALVNNNSAILNWKASSDDHTPQKGLTYNLRVGTTPGSSDIMSPMASTSGTRKVVQMGNVNQNTSWTLRNLKPGTYYWSVQVIDTAFAGSEFATEGTFTVV